MQDRPRFATGLSAGFLLTALVALSVAWHADDARVEPVARSVAPTMTASDAGQTAHATPAQQSRRFVRANEFPDDGRAVPDIPPRTRARPAVTPPTDDDLETGAGTSPLHAVRGLGPGIEPLVAIELTAADVLAPEAYDTGAYGPVPDAFGPSHDPTADGRARDAFGPGHDPTADGHARDVFGPGHDPTAVVHRSDAPGDSADMDGRKRADHADLAPGRFDAIPAARPARQDPHTP